MLNKFKEKRFLPFVAALVIVGIIISVLSFGNSRDALEYEDSAQLLDMASNIDFNISRIIQHIRTDLTNTAASAAFNEGLDEYYLTGSSTGLKNAVSNLKNNFYPLYTPVIISEGTVILYSSDNKEKNYYVFPDGFDSDGLCICKTTDDIYYLASSVSAKDGRAALTFMIELNAFYSLLASDTLTEEYWLVLYDHNADVFLQNDVTQPTYTHFTEEDALKRNDGYSLLVQAEKNKSIATDSYLFKNNDGSKEIHNLMAAISSAKSDNQYFAVGIAKDGSKIRKLILQTYGNLLMGLGLISLGFGVMAFLFLKSSTENAKKQSLMSELENQNREMQMLLDKSRELEHIQRLETIGTMTSSIAHEFNNLLTPIMGYSMMLIQKTPEDSENMDELFEIYTSASKAKEVIERLSSLSRKNTGASYKLLVPNELAKRTLSIAKTATPKNTAIHSDFRCSQPCLMANEVQIVQVLLNLILNSFQAMEDRPGDIYLSTWCDDDTVYFRTEDTAGGIPEDAIDHIFEPFFTTKAPSEGTGLGLPIVNQIVKEHGGSLLIDNRPGEGCTFTVKLPAAREKNVELS